MNPLDGDFIRPEVLAKYIEDTKDFRPEVLVLDEESFNALVMACRLHGMGGYIRTEYLKLGIECVVWAEYLERGQIELTTKRSLPEGIETLAFKKD